MNPAAAPPTGAPTRRGDLAAVALIAALVLLFFWRVLTPRLEDRAVFPPGDFTDQFWTFRMYTARALATGRLPLWSENFNSGHPFLADVQSAVFYPVGLVLTLSAAWLRGGEFTLLDLELEAIIHFILAGAFTYLFARRRLGSRPAALVSALTFVFGGYLTSYPPLQLAILESVTWLPLALLFLDRATELGNARASRDYALGGLVLGVAVLAGHPQTFLFIVYACGIYLLWRTAGLGRRERVPHLVRGALALGLAAGVSAIQWLPTVEYQAVSTRGAISWAEAARGLPTIDPLQMILPGFASAFQSPLYIGVLPLWLAVLALFVHRSREKVFWALLALGSLVVAFGFYVFGYALLYLAAPGWALFRDQERLAGVVSFALALLAGFGARDLMASALDAARARRAWALLPAGLTVSAVMLFSFYVSGAQHSSGRLAFLLDRSGLMVLVFLLATVVAGAWMRAARSAEKGTVSRGRWAALAVALILFDLYSINSAAYNAEPKPRYPETPITQALQADPEPFRVVDEHQMPGHFGIAYRVEETGGISPLRVARYDRLLTLPPEAIWPLLNVRYIITNRASMENAEAIAAQGEMRLFRRNDALPRAWLVGAAQGNMADEAALAAMQKSDFDPSAVAYVAEPLQRPVVANAASSPVTWVAREPERLVVVVSAPTDQLLVLSEVSYPGWRATVDGVPAPVLRADYALRAVEVPAGAHRIEMVFDPWSVKLGIAISAAALAGFCLFLVGVSRSR